MKVPHVYFGLIEACAQPGCPACRLTRKAVEQYLESVFYERVNDVSLRQQLRQGLGFCHVHTWLLLDSGLGDALGMAIIYKDVLVNVLRGLPEGLQDHEEGWRSALRKLAARPNQAVEGIVQALTPQAACPACEQEASSSELVLSVLVDALDQDEMVSALQSSEGLCLPHLRQAFQHAQEARAAQLVEIHRPKLEALQAELDELIRKNDYRFRQENFGSERDAYRRAASRVTGEK